MKVNRKKSTCMRTGSRLKQQSAAITTGDDGQDFK
jgi:hypothetical protein